MCIQDNSVASLAARSKQQFLESVLVWAKQSVLQWAKKCGHVRGKNLCLERDRNLRQSGDRMCTRIVKGNCASVGRGIPVRVQRIRFLPEVHSVEGRLSEILILVIQETKLK